MREIGAQDERPAELNGYHACLAGARDIWSAAWVSGRDWVGRREAPEMLERLI
jgi:hypothetical protein